MGARRVWARGIVLQCALLLFACKSYDASLLEQDPGPIDSMSMAGRKAGDAGVHGPDAGDTTKPQGSGGGGGNSGANAGSGGAGELTKCVENPDSKTCPMRCPETCNSEDDDCDGKIDEGAEATCDLDHAEAACTGGHCVIVSCSKNYRDCDDEVKNGCEAAADDVANCGSCGNQCDLPNAIAACKKGKCVAIGCDGLFDDCDDNENDCETAANTLDNCARCGLSCTEGDVANATPSCERGFCGVGECFMGYGDCNKTPGDGCEQTLDTLDHCGGCKKDCDLPGSVDDCSAGVCLAGACDDGYDDCDGNKANGCETLDADANCGGCGKTCDGTLANVSDAGCDDAKCKLDCSDGYDNCDSDPGTGCETPVTTRERCGDCDTPCAINNAVVSCGTGTCKVTRCEDGWDDCNDDDSPDDGCETRLDSLENCGGCKVPCNKASCSGGVCTAADCSAPPHNDDCGGTHCGNCDGDDSDCEKNLDTDEDNCGTCGHACDFNNGVDGHGTLACTAQGCRATCADGKVGNCNGDYRDGCETPLTTLQNCKTCGTGCSIPNATPTCGTGTCQVSQCAADWKDCDNNKLSCETQLGTTQNCTDCGAACSLPNAVPSCIGSAGSHSCAISSCTQSYYADCDTMPGNGCEIDKRSSTKNCGQCGNDCSTHPHVQSASCGNGNCNYNCAGGFGNCTGASGCETPLTTLTDCAGCGITCARSNGSASCSSGQCTLTGCNDGFENCDGSAANGCEPLTTLQNCGGCNTPCSVVNGSATCADETCQIDNCNAGWDDCDGDPSNGCERNVKAPADGGLGPCLPESGCTHQTFNGRDYYFCTTDRTFSDARAHCQLQLLGELVHIDNSGENNFVQPLLAVDAWIGGIDTAVEGKWRWANDDALFWSGAANGTASGYANWNANEPNNSGGNEDCSEIYASSGKWNDSPCSEMHDYVCEVQPDLCPNNPNKANPGQCGCDVADTDTDGDLTSDCNDACPTDIGKVTAGQCGCGVADTDSDGDHTANCNDSCPMDTDKTEPLVCGCGVAETNSDTDSTPDCHDDCPLDGTRTSAPCGFSYTPTNFEQSAINFGNAPTITLDCQNTTTIDTTPGAATPFANWCGTVPTALPGPQSSGGDAMIVPLQGLTIAAGKTLRVIGTRPLILAVRGDVIVNGTINAKGIGATAGAGGNTACSTGKGSNGGDTSNSGNGGGGGGGAGFVAVGVRGGAGNRSSGSTAGGNAGGAETSNSLSPLRGGCNGGRGGNSGGTGGSGGAGGGTIQISASGTITIAANAVVTASGGGGLNSSSRRDGGGGGGSGGGVFLEAGSVNVNTNAWVTANGGAGASGSANANSTGSAPGTDGFNNNANAAPGGPTSSTGGKGGDGGASPGATGGADGQCTGFCIPFLDTFGAGGGGGGGGVGRIRVHGISSCTLTGSFSPAATKTCP